MATRPPRRGPLQRLPAGDFSTAEEVLKAAAFLAVPENQTQRQAFEGLMPYLFVLRNKGFSFQQLAGLLTACGFNLKPSSVGIYFNKIAAARKDFCQQHMSEHTLQLAEVRRETKGAEMSSITGRVEAIMSRQRTMAAEKLDAVFGSSPVAASPTVAPVLPVATPAPPPPPAVEAPGTVTPRVENKETGLRPAPQNAGVGPERVNQAEKSAVQSEARSQPSVWTCSPLPEGVKSLEERDGVPKDMYLPGNLEHPAAPGIWLSLEQRLSSVALEFVNSTDGEIRLETPHEKRFRILWKTPIPPTETRTGGSFTKMDMSLFKER